MLATIGASIRYDVKKNGTKRNSDAVGTIQ